MEHQFDAGVDSGVAAKATTLHAAKVWDHSMGSLTTHAGHAGQEKALLKAVGIDAPPGSAEAVRAAKMLRHNTDGKTLEYQDPLSGHHVIRRREPGHGGNFDMMVIDKVADGHSVPDATKIATIIAKMKAARGSHV